jgi:eukaryotic-like serine/threonine-protein kinase
MTGSNHDLLLRLFEKALTLPPAARQTFLDSKCRGDAELEQRLQAMLAAADGHTTAAPSSLRRAEEQAVAATAALREGPGSRIGPYKLLQQIGEGGFGVVFLAEQEQPVARRVALKIVKLGMDTRQVVARFEQERQALALMDHPNIARVLDAGSTDTGRPFFVMDLVKGAPILEYCDQNNLTIDERLNLFAQVCRAVQHAHGKGIIHRDLKPSNVLVGSQDGSPQAKVIDFGIAKATSQKLTDKTLFTEHQQVIGTLQYMSPEQAEGSLDIDTRTDVYSLGVLLYELLTGTTPFPQKSINQALLGELQRLIREVDPPRPSTRLSDSHEAIASIAAHRRIAPQRLGTLVRGELDWIVMKALEKDRSRRYETANGLAMDIGRYLAGDGVLAAPPSATYRLRKFVRRNRSTVAAAAAVAIALLIGAIGFAWQANVAQDERDVARRAERAEVEQRGLAERSRDEAAAVNKFLLDMLGAADIRKLGREAKVSQALDEAAAKVRKAFADRPAVEGAVREVLAHTYLSIGMLDEAEPQIDAAIELARRVHGPASFEYAQALADRGHLKSSRGEDLAAVEVYRQAAELAAAAKGADDTMALAMRTEYANGLVKVGRKAEAEQMLRELLATRTRLFGRENNDTLITINSLAVLLHGLNRLDEAEALYREAVGLGAKALGAEHTDTLTARMNLASLLRSRDKLAEAEPIMVAVYADLRKMYGDSHTRTAEAAKVLSDLYRQQGRFKDALPLLEECVAILRRAEGEQTEGVAIAKRALALTLKRLGDRKRATELQREVTATYTLLHGAEDVQTLNARQDLANGLDPENAVEAEAIFKDLLAIAPRALGEDSQVNIIANNSYAVFLMGKDRYAEAEPWARKALEIGSRVEGPEHENTIITQLNLSCIERELGQLDQAAELGRACVDSFARVFGPQHPNTAVAKQDYAAILKLQGHNDAAQEELSAAIAINKAALGDKNPGFCSPAIDLARMLLDAGKAKEAEPVLREVEAVYADGRGDRNPRAANASLELGRCLEQQRRFGEAEALFTRGKQALDAALPTKPKDQALAERYLAAFYTAWNAAEPDAARAAKAAEWQTKVDARR